MIGKSTAAKNACASHTGAKVLENDTLMQQLFDVVHLEHFPISDMQEWQHKVNEKADCSRLIRLHHRDWVACHRQTEIIVAEGYPYMKKWYRDTSSRWSTASKSRVSLLLAEVRSPSARTSRKTRIEV